MKKIISLCPCGTGANYNDCCGLYLDLKQIPPNAEVLMRSRYTAYTLMRENYLLASWHASTRPLALDLTKEPLSKWIRLEVKRYVLKNESEATVEFIAKYKINGKAYHMHEISCFVKENGNWFYVEGELSE